MRIPASRERKSFPFQPFPVPGSTLSRPASMPRVAASTVRPREGRFRLAVDRSFTLAGHGPAVTGTVLSGAVRVGDHVRVSPAGLDARVRSIHAQNQPVERGRSGATMRSGSERTAHRQGGSAPRGYGARCCAGCAHGPHRCKLACTAFGAETDRPMVPGQSSSRRRARFPAASSF